MNIQDLDISTLIKKAKKTKSKKKYWVLISELRKRGSQAFFETCVELTNSKSKKERRIGFAILSQLTVRNKVRFFGKKVIKLFFKHLRIEKSSNNVMSILYGIGHNSEHVKKKQIKLLIPFKDHPKSWVREGVTFALYSLESKSSIKALIQLSQDKYDFIRDWATFGLANYETDNRKIRVALWQRLSDKHKNTRSEAIYGLAKRKDRRIIKVIQKELKNDDFGVLLFDSIIEYQSPLFLPKLKKLYRRDLNDNSVNKIWFKKLKETIVELKKLN